MAPFALGPDAAAASHRLLALDEVGSTSAAAREGGRGGDAGDLWVAARRQTAGYGRRGRAWQSPDGNLAASLLTMVAVPPAEAATLGFIAGLALHRAIAATAPALAGRITLKWPNDALLDGAKLAGILVEAEAAAGGRQAVVIGIGVNVVAAPRDLPATSLASRGAAVSAAALFAALTDAWVPLARQWEEGGFAALRAAWLACASGLGGPISAELGRETVGGVFETIDEGGRLVIRGGDGARRTVAAGEVHFGAARTAQLTEAG